MRKPDTPDSSLLASTARTRRSPPLRSLGALALTGVLAFVTAAPAAWAEADIVLSWMHPEPSSVSGYRIHTRTEGGAYDAGVDVAIPPVGPDGKYAATISIPEGIDVYVRISAYNIAGASPLSTQENRYLLQAPPTLGKPGQPTLATP